ncbi:hypothetical protein AVEN_74290-1 [Araneus ventricosus]|uniref:Uncharacterized protein n=1 Tax=Araneus ventricosus TaxID=182803 RepID=A0A4Y2RW12_ARAVE|nr:hypothetical protein AVEN_74290-1 [Araneus ventricosus]
MCYCIEWTPLFGRNNLHLHYWTDSTTVLAWIQNDKALTVFVNNRVMEIRQLSDKTRWKRIPGTSNPAEFPSRGCRVNQLIASGGRAQAGSKGGLKRILGQFRRQHLNPNLAIPMD